MSHASNLLAIESLTLAIGPDDSRPLFGGLCCEIATAQVIGLVGPSGSGKSTLLRAMAGLDARAKGPLRWRGRTLSPSDMPTFRSEAIYVAQTPVRFSMSAGHSLEEPFSFRSRKSQYDARRAQELCQTLRLPDDILDRRLTDISGGEAQRISLIRALLLEPQVLLLDEPASSLDANAREALAGLLKTWLADNDTRALVICSHEPSWCQGLLTERWTLGTDGHLETQTL